MVDYNLRPIKDEAGNLLLGEAKIHPYANSPSDEGTGFAFDLALIQFPESGFQGHLQITSSRTCEKWARNTRRLRI